MKKLIASLLFLLCVSLFAQIRVGVLTGPSCIPAAHLLESVVSINDTDLTYESFANPNQLLPKMLKDEIDIAFLPPNVAAKVYNTSAGKILCAAVTGYGNLSIITNDQAVTSLEDLKGKTLNVAGAGATPEYMLRYILSKKGIKADSTEGITLDFSIPTQQLVPLLLSGKISYALLPEPFVSLAGLKNQDINVCCNIQNEYAKLEGKNAVYPLTVMVVSKKFAEENTFSLNKFLLEYKESLSWTLENPVEAGILCEELQLGLNKEIVTASIPKANYVYLPAKKAKKALEKLFTIFLQNDDGSIGGKLPDSAFYY